MRPTKLLFLLSAALLLLLAGCASQAPATDQEEAAAPAPAVTETAAPRQGGPGEPLIFLKGDGQGMVTTRWAEGDRAVQVTLPFTYTTQENGEMRIAGIGEATIENLGGWFYVDPKVEIQEDEIFLSQDGWVANVPFQYYASQGSGAHTYDGVMVLELNTWSTTPAAEG